MTESRVEIIWTDYVNYRARLRGFDLATIEHIVRYSGERYVDTTTDRFVAVGRMADLLVLIPYESGQGTITPVTVHATTRQQINFRLKTGRFVNE
jgi:hypothetical protein